MAELYKLTVNGLLDGAITEDTDYCTFDVYINTKCVAQTVAHFEYDNFPEGTYYEVKNIYAGTGKKYNGVNKGSLEGSITKDTLVQLKFSSIKYTITYDANGGNETPIRQTKLHGKPITLSKQIEKSYYVYTTFDANGGKIDSSSSKLVSSKVYYPFNGWKASNGVLYNAETLYTTNESTTMTAQWGDVNGFSVHFPTDPTKEGYSFKGWYTSKTGGTKVTSYSPTSNTTLYAQWKPNNYKLTIQGYIDGNLENGILGYGLFDVYIDGEEYQLDCDDEFTVSLPYGSFYEIKNIRAEKTTVYNGVFVGNLSGTIDEDKIIILQFSTKVITTDLNVKVKVNGQAKQGIKGVIRKNNQNKKIIHFYTKVNGFWKLGINK